MRRIKETLFVFKLLLVFFQDNAKEMIVNIRRALIV